MTERDWPYLDRVKAMNDDLRASIAEQNARADAAEAERAGLSRHLMDSQAEVERLRAQVEFLAPFVEANDGLGQALVKERAAVARVRALHIDSWQKGVCDVCEVDYQMPCATIRALDGGDET